MKKVAGEFTSDRDSASAGLSAVVQYLDQLKDEDVVEAKDEEEHELQEKVSGSETSGSSSSRSSSSGSSSTVSSEESNAEVEALVALEEFTP